MASHQSPDEYRDTALKALRVKLEASIEAGGDHSDDDIIAALDAEEADLKADGY